jgi:tRNA threonylcarbamoyl adenosine modification protein YeaZ
MTDEILLAIDTATTRIVVAVGTLDGRLLEEASWPAGYRHGETLLPAIERILDDPAWPRTAIAGIVVGTGPGAFTGLRVGIATAKGLAHGLGRPIVGVPTGDALLAAAARTGPTPIEGLALLLPAGPSDRILVRVGETPAILPAGSDPSLGPATHLVAVDLEGRAPADACAAGERARSGLALELITSGAARLAAGAADDLARLVPEYVTLPRGAAPSSGEVAWSHDPR